MIYHFGCSMGAVCEAPQREPNPYKNGFQAFALRPSIRPPKLGCRISAISSYLVTTEAAIGQEFQPSGRRSRRFKSCRHIDLLKPLKSAQFELRMRYRGTSAPVTIRVLPVAGRLPRQWLTTPLLVYRIEHIHRGSSTASFIRSRDGAEESPSPGLPRQAA